MIIYPDIEIQNGKCVQLAGGRMDEPIVYDIHPVDAACGFVAEGAEWLHVVDLDAVAGKGSNADLIATIIRKACASVQVAGAIRSIDTVRDWIDIGAGRVVIATAAVKDPAFVRAAAHAYPDQVVVSVDCRQGRVVVKGWSETTAFTPVEFANQFSDVPLAAIIYTDIDRDEDRPESCLSHTAQLAAAVGTPVIASGVVKSLDDISTLKYLHNISGAITGRALFGGTFTLTEALDIVHEPPEPIAAFM